MYLWRPPPTSPLPADMSPSRLPYLDSSGPARMRICPRLRRLARQARWGQRWRAPNLHLRAGAQATGFEDRSWVRGARRHLSRRPVSGEFGGVVSCLLPSRVPRSRVLARSAFPGTRDSAGVGDSNRASWGSCLFLGSPEEDHCAPRVCLPWTRRVLW